MNTVADSIYYNGVVYSADANDSIFEAIAIKDGFVQAIGSNDEILKLVGASTEKTDLMGKMLMPGIIDGHMHPYWGAKSLANCSLKYESLTAEETLSKIREFLKKTEDQGEEAWLQVRSWLRIGGSDVTRYDLDTIDTKRPIILFSNDCHFIALNSKALDLLNINENTPEPLDGNILRDEKGVPTGIIEDAPAMRYYDEVSSLQGQHAANVMNLAQKALNKQGVTTVMDTRADWEAFDTLTFMEKNDQLTLRFLGAREITPNDCPTPADADKAVQGVLEFAKKYDNAHWTPKPSIAVTHLKLFIDGMPTNNTAYVREPYFENKGTDENPKWERGTDCGTPYFSEDKLKAIFPAAAKYGFHPHMHVIADGAAEIVLNGIEEMRKQYPDKDIRPGVAHSDIIAPHQYKRYADLKALPVLSYQWCGQPQDLIEYQRGLYGDERFEGLETHGKFVDAGCTLVYGSDWPIDPLNEWNNFQAGLTRRIPTTDNSFPRLDTDRDLTILEVLQSITRHAAIMLAKEDCIGSLEKGKFADLVILDRNLFTTPVTEVMNTKVLQTVVGGKTVFTA